MGKKEFGKKKSENNHPLFNQVKCLRSHSYVLHQSSETIKLNIPYSIQ